METAKEEFLLGQRIASDQHIGTVRYIGPLVHSLDAKSEEIYIGVEWDDENRGKHNGTVNGLNVLHSLILGHQYFNCEEGKGSLVPLRKLQRGKVFYKFLKKDTFTLLRNTWSLKVSPLQFNDSFSEDLFWVDSRTQLTKQVELVGMDK